MFFAQIKDHASQPDKAMDEAKSDLNVKTRNSCRL